MDITQHRTGTRPDLLDELAEIYVGVAQPLARQVAQQLMAKDALTAHARDELGISEITTARPVQAALTSAVMFSVGAACLYSWSSYHPLMRLSQSYRLRLCAFSCAEAARAAQLHRWSHAGAARAEGCRARRALVQSIRYDVEHDNHPCQLSTPPASSPVECGAQKHPRP